MNYGNKSNNRRAYQPKTSITNQVITEQEKLAAETALRSLKQKMANKEKKPIRQTNTANQGRRLQNYNNANMKGNNYIHMSHTPNYNNNMKYNYPSNVTEINKTKGYYSNAKQNINNKKPITANDYQNNHNYNENNNVDLNDNDIYMNQNNYQKRNYNQNQYNMNNRNNNYKNSNNNNNYYKNYNNNIGSNYSNNNNYNNNFQLGKPQRLHNASANPNKNNYNINNYNNYNYNQKMSTQDDENDDPRPIGGGLTADQVPDVTLPTQPCPHCGRSFNSNAFSKHIKICEKVFLKKRKAYNAQKYRFNDSEQASLMKQGAMKEKMNPLLNKKNSGQIPKWKLQSMAFRQICNPDKYGPKNQSMINNNKSKINNNVMVKNKIKGGNMMNNNKIDNTGYENMGGAMNYAMAYDYKHCEFCNRNYNEEAYNKHLNFCKRRYENEKLKNKAKKTSNNNSGIKNQYSKGIYGSVKYNNNVKYNKKK